MSIAAVEFKANPRKFPAISCNPSGFGVVRKQTPARSVRFCFEAEAIALSVALDEIARGAEGLQVRLMSASAPCDWLDVVDVFGWLAASAAERLGGEDGPASFSPLAG